MKLRLRYLTILFLLLSLPAAQAQCDVTIQTQTEADNVAPLITAVACNGTLTSLTISTLNAGVDPITDLSALSVLDAVTGDLTIEDNASLGSLDGLENLASVGGNFSLARNATLSDVSGLSGLETVTGDFIIDDNAGLIAFDGLSSLTGVGGDLIFIVNQNLETIDGLNRLVSVGGDLAFTTNASLSNLDGLSRLASVGAIFSINNNDALLDVGGLSKLETVGGILSINGNQLLANVDGLSKLASVGGNLSILNNASITDLDGLSKLTTISAAFNVRDNGSLTSVEGLSSLTTVNGTINFIDNAVLSMCELSIVCDRVLNTPSTISVSGNTGDCANERPELFLACGGVLPVELLEFTASARPKFVELRWMTASESGSSHFAVERTTSAGDWVELSRIAAAGDHRGELSYAFNDRTAIPGRNLYRLRQVDLDGSEHLGPVRVVDFGVSTRVWPNPFAGTLSIAAPAPTEYRVMDTFGREVASFTYPGGGQRDFTLDLPGGVYFLRGGAETVRLVRR